MSAGSHTVVFTGPKQLTCRDGAPPGNTRRALDTGAGRSFTPATRHTSRRDHALRRSLIIGPTAPKSIWPVNCDFSSPITLPMSRIELASTLEIAALTAA